jgi:hypothetical protein
MFPWALGGVSGLARRLPGALPVPCSSPVLTKLAVMHFFDPIKEVLCTQRVDFGPSVLYAWHVASEHFHKRRIISIGGNGIGPCNQLCTAAKPKTPRHDWSHWLTQTYDCMFYALKLHD